MARVKKTVDGSIQRKRDVFNYYLRRSGLNKDTLAEKTGYDLKYLYNMIHTGSFTRAASEQIAKVLLCEPEELMEGRLSIKTLSLEEEKQRLRNLEIVSDDIQFYRFLILSQQRAIEELTAALNRLNKDKVSR